MSSLVPGFEYDVFISYRHKDDKYDHWVTDFVSNLKRELDATFRDEVSVYFDSNKSDGLLATHDVDESLKEKLRCLVFIPVISHTYCDPASFAWANEFKTFVQQTSSASGLKVKLPNGNYASRVLPVIIHDLAEEEKVLCERILGSRLRGIEFIYSEPGVNRPLRSNEDNPNNNLARTNYRNQINKVANAIKEIISAIEGNGSTQEITADESINGKEAVFDKKNKVSKWKAIAGSFIILILIIAGFIYVPGILAKDKAIEKSIAVLPFINDSPTAVEENVPFINGLLEEIIINLQTIKEFRVPGRTSVERYRTRTDKSITDIAKELDVNYIVEGSGQKYGNTLRLRVQLIRAQGKEAHLWAKSYEEEINDTKDVFDLQNQIAQAVATELKATISPEEKQKIEQSPKMNLAAYDAYLKGVYFYEKAELHEKNDKAIFWFNESIRLDSAFALPWTYLSMCYWRRSDSSNEPDFHKARMLAEKAVEIDPESAVSIVNMAEILDNEFDFRGAEEKISLALIMEPDNQYVLRNACRFLTKLGRFEDALNYCNKALQIDPNNATILKYKTLTNYYAGNSANAWQTFRKHKELEYKDQTMKHLYYQLLLSEGRYDPIINEPDYVEDEDIQKSGLAAAYFATGKRKEAMELCKALSEKDISAFRMAYIHSFDNDWQKVNEWLEKSWQEKEKELTYLAVEPAFRKFHSESWCKDLLKKTNLF
jgi:TolB-like protein/Flp pilus assembly protein TadD